MALLGLLLSCGRFLLTCKVGVCWKIVGRTIKLHPLIIQQGHSSLSSRERKGILVWSFHSFIRGFNSYHYSLCELKVLKLISRTFAV